ncbi:MAG: IS66 family insertion sequence element accessory protein TnpB [Methylomonas sp.]
MLQKNQWNNHIEAWRGSGLKQSEYCRREGLNANSFAARLSYYRKQQKSALPALIPVQVEAPVTGSIVLKHAKGHQVALPLSTSASWLAELLTCLG